MTHPKNDVERFEAIIRLESLIDAAEESILSASDEEIKSAKKKYPAGGQSTGYNAVTTHNGAEE